MSDVWDSFGQGLRLGGALRAQREQRDRQQIYGHEFQQGGLGAVIQSAGGQGDFDTVKDLSGMQQQQEQTAIQRATRNAEVLSNMATSLQSVPYEQRRAQIEQMTPQLTAMGLDAAQVQGFDPTDEALANVRGLSGQFSRFREIRNGENGEILGVGNDGQVTTLRPGQQPWDTSGTTPFRVTPEGQVETGQGTIPHVPRATQAPIELTDETIDFAAQQYVLTGQLPPAISRNSRLMPLILERAQQIVSGQGRTAADMAVGQVDYQSLRQSWIQMQRQRTMIEAFETTALENLTIAEELSARVSRGGTPVFNRWILAGRRSVQGDADVAAFDVAVNTFVNEYAKIMSGSTGAAGATEGAREEAAQLLNSAQTPQQFRAIVAVMRRDMHNRTIGFQRTEESLRRQMLAAGGGAAGEDGGTTPPPSNPHNRAMVGGRPFGGADDGGGLETMTDEDLMQLRDELAGGAHD